MVRKSRVPLIVLENKDKTDEASINEACRTETCLRMHAGTGAGTKNRFVAQDGVPCLQSIPCGVA